MLRSATAAPRMYNVSWRCGSSPQGGTKGRKGPAASRMELAPVNASPYITPRKLLHLLNNYFKKLFITFVAFQLRCQRKDESTRLYS